MTMRELARLASVSVSTVSKAFRDADDISEETRNIVFETAKKYGCYGKFYKGKFHKQVISIICPELGSGFYTTYIERLQEIIESHDGIALVSADHFSQAAQAELVDYYASYLQVDGIIVFQLQGALKKGYEIPIVSLLSSPNTSVDTVQVNLEGAIFEAVDMLRCLGHEKIAFIGEQHTHYKASCFCKAMGNIPMDSPCIIESPFRFEKAGENGALQLINQEQDYTALICAYDYIAFGAIKKLKRHGYSVPGDYSVVGIDNVSTSAHAETALSTIDTNPNEVCMVAWDIIQKKQKSKYYRSTQSILISGRLIMRETVAPPRQLPDKSL